MSHSKEELQEALSKAKIKVMATQNTTFFSTLMLGMTHKFDDSIPTACTDGLVCSYNPQFFMDQCAPDERPGLVLHETMHPAFEHVRSDRIGQRDHKRWNGAGDYVINGRIDDLGFKLPQNGLLDHQYDGMSTEQVYDALPLSFKMPSDLLDIQSGTPDTKQQQTMDRLLVRAVTASKAAGDKPGSIPQEIDRYVHELLNPRVAWYKILRSLMTSTLAKLDWTYRKPNRRYFPEHILPSQFSEGLANITVAIDTSGSVSQAQIAHFITEVEFILKNLKPTWLDFICWDSTMKQPQRVYSLSEVKNLKIKGGGGTNVEPVMQWAAENKPAAVLVFTDGHFKRPKTRPRCPVIWVIDDNPKWKAPFGRKIDYSFEELRQAA